MKQADVPESREYDSADELAVEVLNHYGNLAERVGEEVRNYVFVETKIGDDRFHLTLDEQENAPLIQTEFGIRPSQPATIVLDTFVDAAKCAGRRVETDFEESKRSRFVGYVPVEPNPREGSE